MERMTLEKCNVIKVVMMLSVALGHSCALWMGNWFSVPADPAPYLGHISSFLGTFHIYVFTFVSGYIFYYTQYQRANKAVSMRGAILHKAKRLLLPYIFVALCWVIPFDMCFNGLSIKEVFNKYILATAPSQLWFLLMLFVVTVALNISSGFFLRVPFFVGMFICSGVYLMSRIGGYLLPNVFQIWTAGCYIVYFYLGFSMRRFGFDKLYKIPWIMYLILDVGLYFLRGWFSESNSILSSSIVQLSISEMIHLLGVATVVVGIAKLDTNRL